MDVGGGVDGEGLGDVFIRMGFIIENIKDIPEPSFDGHFDAR